MRQLFVDWYPEQIRTGLDNGLQLERIKVKIILSDVRTRDLLISGRTRYH